MTNNINDDFALELKELRTAALELREGIDRHNFLPPDFPKQQIELHLLALGGLLEGSLEGAKLPLEHASVRLAEIRRKHFLHHQDVLDDEDAASPALERGDALDVRFTRLLSAVSTALDAYRENSRSEFESLNSGEYLELLPAFGSPNLSSPSIGHQLDQLDDLANSARNSTWSKSPQVENVAVSAVDARNVLAAAEAEAVAAVVIRGWARRLAKNSADALSILSKSLRAIESGSGVAHEFYLRYKSSISRVRDVLIVEAREWLKFLSLKVADAEKAVRRYADGHPHGNFGMVSSLGGHRTVLTSDFIVFPIHQSQFVNATKGLMVEFDLDTSLTPPSATNLRPTSKYILIDGQLLTPEQARAPILRRIEEFLATRTGKMAPIRYLDRRLTSKDRRSPLPARYWNLLGYDSIASFIQSADTLFGFPSKDNMTHVSLAPLELELIPVEKVCDWSYAMLNNFGGRLSLGELARLASDHFSQGLVPIRLQTGVDQFSSIFDGDRRFWLKNGNIQTIESAWEEEQLNYSEDVNQ